MKRRLRRVALNPLLVVVPAMVLLVLGWRHYTYAGLSLNLPEPSQNLMPNGNFEQSRNGEIAGWQIGTSGDTAAPDVSLDQGYVGGRTLALHVRRYTSGDVTLISPKVRLQPRQTYLYKGYYKSNLRFVLAARYYYATGSSALVWLQTYRDSADAWATVSDAFDASQKIVAVQYVYRLTSAGWLEVNGVYLEPKQHVFLATIPTARNIIPNPGLAAPAVVNMPDGWQPYQAGNNTAAFSYNHDDGTYLQVSASQFKSGEAKWEYEPQAVTPQQYYQFGVAYKSDVPTIVVAEYVMRDGRRQFDTLANLPSAGDWTNVGYSFEVPPAARTMMVSVVLQRNGTLASRDYQLMNITKAGVAHWKRPLVSVTFDDGWQSAYTDALPELQRHGLLATFYINPSSIETPNFMTAAELRELARAGNEIAAHGYAHDDMTTLNDEALAYQLREGRDYLRQAGFRITDFATPYGSSDAEVQWYARSYFETLRSTVNGLNTRQNFDPYNLQVLYVDGTTSKDEVAGALQQAKSYDGWLILVYHRVSVGLTKPTTNKVENTTVETAAFSQQMDLVKRSGITVLPVAAAYSEVSKQ